MGADPRDRVTHDVHEANVGEVRGDPLWNAAVSGKLRVRVRGFADGQDMRVGHRELLPVPVDPTVPVRLLHEELRRLVLRRRDLWMRTQVVIEAGRPGLHRTDEQECRESPTGGVDVPGLVRHWSDVLALSWLEPGKHRGPVARPRQRGRSWRSGRPRGRDPVPGRRRTARSLALDRPSDTSGEPPGRGSGYADLRTGPTIPSPRGQDLGPQFREPCVRGRAPRVPETGITGFFCPSRTRNRLDRCRVPYRSVAARCLGSERAESSAWGKLRMSRGLVMTYEIVSGEQGSREVGPRARRGALAHGVARDPATRRGGAGARRGRPGPPGTPRPTCATTWI